MEILLALTPEQIKQRAALRMMQSAFPGISPEEVGLLSALSTSFPRMLAGGDGRVLCPDCNGSGCPYCDKTGVVKN